jgi:hypothetical protein
MCLRRVRAVGHGLAADEPSPARFKRFYAACTFSPKLRRGPPAALPGGQASGGMLGAMARIAPCILKLHKYRALRPLRKVLIQRSRGVL